MLTSLDFWVAVSFVVVVTIAVVRLVDAVRTHGREKERAEETDSKTQEDGM